MRKRSPQGGKPFAPKRARPTPGPDRTGRSRGSAPSDVVTLYGWHPVVEALRNPKRQFRRLLATENAAQRLLQELGRLPLAPQAVRPDDIAALLPPDAVHQGLLLEAVPLPVPGLKDLPAEGVVLVLDQITDPHNVGAILRTATAFGVAAIVTTARNTPEATGVLAKSASGGLEHTPFILVGNLARALTELGDIGFQRIGLDSEAPADLSAIDPTGPIALVLGAEGKGMRHLTREHCDVLARLDLPGPIKSLNVSNAAAIALYVATHGRRTP